MHGAVWRLLCPYYLLLHLRGARCVVHDIEAYGAVRTPSSQATASLAAANSAALGAALSAARPGDAVLVNGAATGVYVFGDPVLAANLHGVELRFEGHLVLDDNITRWPVDAHAWLTISDASSLTVHGGGTIDGQGLRWWDASITGSVPGVGKWRPNLLNFHNVSHLLLENVTLHDSPRWHINLRQCAHVLIRYVAIDVDRFAVRAVKARAHAARLTRAGLLDEGAALSLTRRLYSPGGRQGSWEGGWADGWEDRLLDELVRLLPAWALQPEDLNTDGIDANGVDFHVHDCVISNDDDSITVKPSNGRDTVGDCSRDMLFERLVLSGFGASIGSVPPSPDRACVSNVTFRNISMPGTGKGIYVKSNPACGEGVDRFGRRVPKTALIEGITFEDVHIERPFWWPVWIGPQQQHEPGSPLGAKCAIAYPLKDSCPTQGCSTFANITLRRVTIDYPLLSPGVVLGNATNPMSGITFEDVVVAFNASRPRRGTFPWGPAYQCQHAHVRSVGSTSPAPVCENVR